MDAYKPFLGPIVRLDVSHKPTFHVAGVQHYKVEKVKNDFKSEMALKRQQEREDKIPDSDEDEEENQHHEENKGENLDTWA